MVQYDELWNDINTLLTRLHDVSTDTLIDTYLQHHPIFYKFIILDIERLQKHLDSAPHKV